jgi:hypothetical protein
MATQTTHYNLTKPDLTDLVDVTALNDNADIIDDAIYEASQSGGAAMIESSVEETTTSAHAYAVGDYFIYNNTLYAVTAAIAIGDTITPGTNCAATTVMNELANVDNSEEMTLAQYNALTPAQQMDGTVRYITDVSALPDAAGVGF